MRPNVLLYFLGFLLLLIISSQEESRSLNYPKPDSGIIVLNTENEGNQNARLEWFDRMHRSAPGVKWEEVEYRNSIQKSRSRKERSLRADCSSQAFVNSQIQAQWQERGSDNQAGSVLDATYLAARDEIWVISDGGSLLKRSRTVNDWKVINQDLRFNRGFLQFIEKENGHRLLAFINHWLHYSDDYGEHWVASDISGDLLDYQGFMGLPVISKGEEPMIAFFSKPTYYSNLKLLVSKDGGQTLELLREMDGWNFSDFKLLNVPPSKQLLLLERTEDNYLEIKEIDFSQSRLKALHTSSTFPAGDGALEAQAFFSEEGIQLYFLSFDGSNSLTQLFSTANLGKDWNLISDLPINPWDFTFHINPDQDLMYIGGVEAYRSLNNGIEWERINYWYDYYSDIENNLHADIMYVDNFKTAEGAPFTLISNHGGISISYDNFETQKNLGLKDLNVSQYYSVRTSRADARMIFAGSQDQGLQVAVDVQEDSILSFEQVISGDYGHLAFTQEGNSLWAAYPGGSIYYVDNIFRPREVSNSFELESPDEFIWIAPLVASPLNTENAVYIAGGNHHGEEGSYLIKLSNIDGTVISEQIEQDFKASSDGGTISAIGMSSTHPNYWYVATSNGRFFSSKNAGEHWEQTAEFTTQGSYLYGQAIAISSSNPEHVFLAGSGYSNPPVFYSEDGGATFVEKIEGLPPTLVYDLAFDDTENLR